MKRNRENLQLDQTNTEETAQELIDRILAESENNNEQFNWDDFINFNSPSPSLINYNFQPPQMKRAKVILDIEEIKYQIIEAILQNNIITLENLLKDSSARDLNSIICDDYALNSVLHLASEKGHLKAVELLLQAGADITLKNRADDTALHYAAGVSQSFFGTDKDSKPLYLEIVKILIDNKANVNKKNIEGKIPLHYAASSGYVPIIEELIKHGSNINEQGKNGTTPFYEAADSGRKKAVKKLIELKADINIPKNDGTVAFNSAAIKVTNFDSSVTFNKDAKFICKSIFNASTKIVQVKGWIEHDEDSKNMVFQLVKDFIKSKEYLKISAEDPSKFKYLRLYKELVKQEPEGDLKKIGVKHNIDQFIDNKTLMITKVCKAQDFNPFPLPLELTSYIYSFINLQVQKDVIKLNENLDETKSSSNIKADTPNALDNLIEGSNNLQDYSNLDLMAHTRDEFDNIYGFMG